jgi:hypothetical protein
MRFIIGFLIAIGLLIFVFVLIFRGAGNDNDAQQPVQLVEYANTGVAMEFTQVGPVLADQTHREARITVTNQESTIELFGGYQRRLLDSRSYRNNPAAYADFLRALQLAGYNLGNPDKELADDRGFCPTGRRYIMSIKDGGSDVQRYWATTCGGTQTFRGKTAVVRNLFIGQIPDYDKIVGTQL